ncbi:hypothetical protein Afil01_53080 [Actinorhabdospora filicis]|uniref:Uncharacterized protein n=1 Tax=Actinorhabdospora filicis TaxID=1785913 RepID=A0A9W6STK1_9ACTN|nr:hypothetical protein [Actinorhabdospora filicis]GLZ80501.1 hypothetical protein Afil01_53080 [Actinorhabdospora filicis]
MEIHVTVDDDPQALGSLYAQWLAKDPGVRRGGPLETRYAQLGPGEMGGPLETVVQVVGVAGALVTMLTSIVTVALTWRGTRRDGVKARVAVVRPDGTSVEITGETPQAVAAQVKALGLLE